MGKYLDPRADLTFKKIFGEHKHLVISLLNAMLPLADDEQIERIEYWPADKIPDRTEAEKYSIVDVCCRDNKDREFIVEMQMSWTESFKKRVLLNASKAYVWQSKKGMDYEYLQPVYALNFVNGVFMRHTDDYYHYYHLVHDRYTDQVIDGLHLIFVELPKFKAQTITERKMQVLWLRFLTEIDEKTQEVPAELLASPEVCEALEIVERAAFTDSEMRSYDKFWDSISVARTLANDHKRKMKKADELIKKAEADIQLAKEISKQAKEKSERAEADIQLAKEQSKRAEADIKKAELVIKQAEEKSKQAEEMSKQAEEKSKQAEEKSKQAEAKGRSETNVEHARKMKALGVAPDIIAQVTGLTQDEIAAL